MGSIGNAVTAFRRVIGAGEEEKALAKIAKEPLQKRALDQFTKAVAQAKDIKSALRDPRILQVVATAMGIPDGADAPGLAMRALLSDPNDKKSLVNRLPDTRWKAAAQALNLHERGLEALRDPKVQSVLADGLNRARWRDQLEQEQTGLGDAVSFRDRAEKVDGNIYTVLGDPVLRRVVTGALGLPDQMAVQSVETQARAVTKRLKLDKLENPREVQKLAERYLLNVATEEASSTSDSSSLLAAYGWTASYSV
ncbi:DUF1217 domain-containing protein [Roseococcus sp. YIM B11640]|uniref:DUF1217 domain-containing protein n=1 Tax=Roseococcus sp. YIM B11640 TaxID=3133973 RepID=UPI003C79D5DE